MTHNLPHRSDEAESASGGVTRCETESDRGGHRTHDLRIKSPLLYQLSYPVANDQTSTPATPSTSRQPSVTGAA
jgi:hypothetical protein